MKAIKGTIRYKGKVCKYAVKCTERNIGFKFEIDSLIYSNKKPVPAGDNAKGLEEAVLANARLLKWCTDEGWQPFPRKGKPSGFARCPDGYIQRIRKVDALEPPQTMTEPIVFEVLNWVEEQVEEPLYYKGGIEQFLSSGKYEPFVPYEEPVSVLKEGVLYSGENGMIICCKCAGVRASSGFDSSGNTILALPRSVNAEFKKMFGEDMHCERGCTVYTS